jgi:hypothetical protein
MASVRMTNELRSNIRNRAMQAFDTARPCPKPSTWLADRMRDAIINSEPYKTLQRLWDTREQHSFVSFGGYPKPLNREATSHVSVSSERGFTQSGQLASSTLVFEFAPQLNIYRESRWGYPEVRFEELPANFIQDLATPCYELCQDIKTHAANKHEYELKISDLIVQCGTVKQLLLAWPAAESFVPSEHMNRMYTKVNRKQRAQEIKEEVNFDDTFVNEIVLTAKLVGG